MEIKVLGPGCAKCEKTEKIVKEAVEELGVKANVVKVTDTMDIASHGILGTPAVIVDSKVKIVGRVPKKEDVLGWLSE
jgi:small redox-active disulfide protein 2